MAGRAEGSRLMRRAVGEKSAQAEYVRKAVPTAEIERPTSHPKQEGSASAAAMPSIMISARLQSAPSAELTAAASFGLTTCTGLKFVKICRTHAEGGGVHGLKSAEMCRRRIGRNMHGTSGHGGWGGEGEKV